MRLLLDTNTFLWWARDAAWLGTRAKATIRSAEEVHISVVSAWEFYIKKALGKLDLDVAFEEAVELHCFTKLFMTFEHAEKMGKMPHLHGDPFDRMLIAQADHERLAFVTSDRSLFGYGTHIIDARK